MKANGLTYNTTKAETTPNIFGDFAPFWTTRRIKTPVLLARLGKADDLDLIAKVDEIRIQQEGRGNWAAFDAQNNLISGGESLQECFTYLLRNYINA